jgi:hypothetical protein
MFRLGEKASDIFWKGDCLDQRIVLDIGEKRNIQTMYTVGELNSVCQFHDFA